MKKDIVSIIIDGETMKNNRDVLISVCEARGHAAIRKEEPPHYYWQIAEYLKREKLGHKENDREIIQSRKDASGDSQGRRKNQRSRGRYNPPSGDSE